MRKHLILEKVLVEDFKGVYDALKKGFNPNELYWKEDVKSSILWTIKTNRPALDEFVRLLDLPNGKPMEKLLRAFGAKTSNEIREENRAKEEREDFLREKENMKIVNELLAQK